MTPLVFLAQLAPTVLPLAISMFLWFAQGGA